MFCESQDDSIKDAKLEDGALEVNIGIPVVIVGTKADQLPHKNLDVLQQKLRELALKCRHRHCQTEINCAIAFSQN